MPLIQHFLTVIRVFDTASDIYERATRPPDTSEQEADAKREQWIADQHRRYKEAYAEAERRAQAAKQQATRQQNQDTSSSAADPPSSPVPDSTPYDILGLSSNASDAVVRAAFKALMRTHHPDAGGDAKQASEFVAAFERIKKERHWI